MDGYNDTGNKDELRQELSGLLNKYSADNGSNTPDFILAEYLSGCLETFDNAVRQRDKWYGKVQSPGQVDPPKVTF